MDEISAKIAEIDQRSKSNTHRIDRIEQRQDEADKLVTPVQLVAQSMGTVEGDVGEIKSTINKDGLHPNLRGHNLMGDQCSRFVSELYGKQTTR